MKRIAIVFSALLLFSGCVVVREGEIGVKRTFGKFTQKVYPPGLHGYNPLVSTMLIQPIRTVNLEVKLDLPSKEGLTIRSEISILYRIRQTDMPKVLAEIGTQYENTVILSVFRSAAADVCARFYAKDMHSGERATIERQIQERMTELISARGFVIEAVLLKSIQLPAGLAQAIENKLTAEQRSQEMQFVLEREQQEAQRKIIAAEGDRDAQKILAEGLSREILELRQIEALQKLATSPNSKVIMMNSSPGASGAPAPAVLLNTNDK